MIAVQGTYDNGIIRLAEQAPATQADVIVIFPENSAGKNKEIDRDETRKLFDSFSGSIVRHIDEKEERLAALDEKYAGID